jgi:hypothetical protein
VPLHRGADELIGVRLCVEWEIENVFDHFITPRLADVAGLSDRGLPSYLVQAMFLLQYCQVKLFVISAGQKRFSWRRVRLRSSAGDRETH